MSCRYYLLRLRENPDVAKAVEETKSNAASFFGADFREYVNVHGYHFTCELAEYASKMMTNSNGTAHTWSCEDVGKTLETLDITYPETSTIGDMTYTANMAYADFYPLVITDVAACVLYSRSVATDPDGYEGIQFYRWLADLMATDTNIDWLSFV